MSLWSTIPPKTTFDDLASILLWELYWPNVLWQFYSTVCIIFIRCWINFFSNPLHLDIQVLPAVPQFIPGPDDVLWRPDPEPTSGIMIMMIIIIVIIMSYFLLRFIPSTLISVVQCAIQLLQGKLQNLFILLYNYGHFLLPGTWFSALEMEESLGHLLCKEKTTLCVDSKVQIMCINKLDML